MGNYKSEIQEIIEVLENNPELLNLIKIARTDPKLIKAATRQLEILKLEKQ